MPEVHAFEADTTYRFRVTRSVEIARLKLRPIGEHEAKGNALTDVVAQYGPEVIVDARPV